jgi:hypothetical protein
MAHSYTQAKKFPDPKTQVEIFLQKIILIKERTYPYPSKMK